MIAWKYKSLWHDASRSQRQEYALEIGEILHIFPTHPKYGRQGIQKGLHGSEDRYMYTCRPNLVVIDQSW